MTNEGYQAPVCAVCGHTTGDHHMVPRPLDAALPGRCLVKGCDCERFTEHEEQQ